MKTALHCWRLWGNTKRLGREATDTNEDISSDSNVLKNLSVRYSSMDTIWA